MLGDRRPARAAGSSTTTPGIAPRTSISGIVERRAGPARTASGSTPTCGSPPASSSRTSSPGFSGGPKMVAPGLAGLDTTLALHNARRIGDPRATWGVMRGQPGPRRDPRHRRDGLRALQLDVLLNDEQADHRGVRRASSSRCTRGRAPRPGDEAMQPGRRARSTSSSPPTAVPARPEPVPGGQGHVGGGRGRARRRHDHLRGGVPRRAPRPRLLRRAARDGRHAGRAPGASIAASPVTIPDQWQVQIQARVQGRARVLVRTDGLTPGQLRRAHLEAVDDIGGLVRDLVRGRQDARVCVLPEGPQTIAYLG